MFGYINPRSLKCDGQNCSVVFINATTNEHQDIQLADLEDLNLVHEKLQEQRSDHMGITTLLDASVENIEAIISLKNGKMTIKEMQTSAILKCVNADELLTDAKDGEYIGNIIGVRADTKKEILIHRISFKKN